MSWLVQAAAQVPTYPLGTKKKPYKSAAMHNQLRTISRGAL